MSFFGWFDRWVDSKVQKNIPVDDYGIPVKTEDVEARNRCLRESMQHQVDCLLSGVISMDDTGKRGKMNGS